MTVDVGFFEMFVGPIFMTMHQWHVFNLDPSKIIIALACNSCPVSPCHIRYTKSQYGSPVSWLCVSKLYYSLNFTSCVFFLRRFLLEAWKRNRNRKLYWIKNSSAMKVVTILLFLHLNNPPPYLPCLYVTVYIGHIHNLFYMIQISRQHKNIIVWSYTAN